MKISQILLLAVALIAISAMPLAFADVSTGLVGYWKFDNYTEQTIDTLSYDSLIGYWTFNGSSADQTAFWNNATLYGGASLGTDSVDFDGVDGYVDIANNNAIFNIWNNPYSAHPITISMWVELNSFSDSYLFSQKNIGEGKTQLLILANSTGNTIDVFVKGDSEGEPLHASTSIEGSDTGTWHHVVAVFTNYNASVYLDGVLKDTTTDIPTGNPEIYGFTLGSYNETSNFFNGSMRNVKIWNRVLTDAEILAVYNNQTFEVQRNITPDSSGNGNDGSMSSGLSWTTGYNGTQGIHFDEVTSYVDIGEKEILRLNENISITGWVYYYDGVYVFMLSNGYLGTHEFYTAPPAADGERWRITKGTSVFLCGDTILETGGWNMLTATLDATDETTGAKFYINDTLICQTSQTPMIEEYALINNLIGNRPDATSYAPNATYDEVKIYNRVLTSGDITDLFNGETPTVTTTTTTTTSTTTTSTTTTSTTTTSTSSTTTTAPTTTTVAPTTTTIPATTTTITDTQAQENEWVGEILIIFVVVIAVGALIGRMRMKQ
jgi:hypothetical protein